MTAAVYLCKGTAIGYRVARSIIVKIKRFPLVLQIGRGLAISTIRVLNGSVSIGKLINGAFNGYGPLPNSWQT